MKELAASNEVSKNRLFWAPNGGEWTRIKKFNLKWSNYGLFLVHLSKEQLNRTRLAGVPIHPMVWFWGGFLGHP